MFTSADAILGACLAFSIGPGCSVKKTHGGGATAAPDTAATARPIAVDPAPPSATLDAGGTAAAVPREIATRSDLELSGIAWAPSLGKYLVVSDDVATGGEKHPPWVFALSQAGELDAAPIVIDGIPDLNDPESICAGPDGTFFLATSHSRNLKGHVPPGRRRLLHLALAGRALKILGQVDLTDVHGTDGGLFEGAGGAAGLDLEAITWRADGLYLGFKAPLVDGRATILRMADPVAQIASGKVKADSLSVWARPKLCVKKEGDPCQGIADMTFHPDGSLLLVANSPKGAPKDGGGALWKLAGPDKEPALLQWFVGYKPEGIAVAPGKTAATIVFDRDRKQPMWVSWPL